MSFGSLTPFLASMWYHERDLDPHVTAPKTQLDYPNTNIKLITFEVMISSQ